jgi:hypothetical protein
VYSFLYISWRKREREEYLQRPLKLILYKNKILLNETVSNLQIKTNISLLVIVTSTTSAEPKVSTQPGVNLTAVKYIPYTYLLTYSMEQSPS